MAINTNTVWEVRTTGSDTNGGGFNSAAAGVDYSQQNAAQVTLSTAATVHTTTSQINVPLGEHTVHADDIGNILNNQGGTSTAGFYQITAVDVANNRWTMDRAVGTAGQTVAGNMGGALASYGMCGAGATAGNKIWIKSGTYLVTTASTNVSGGCFSTFSVVNFEGYDTVRGDLGTKPLIQASGITNFTLISIGANGAYFVANLEVDGNSLATSNGISVRGMIYRCKAVNFLGLAFHGGVVGTGRAIYCETDNCAGGTNDGTFNGFAVVIACTAHDGTGCGYGGVADTLYLSCISYNMTGDGFRLAANSAEAHNCTAYNCGGDGFEIVPSRGARVFNCIAENNTGWGFNSSANVLLFFNNAHYNNTSGGVNLTGSGGIESGTIAGSSSFFTSPGTGDFSLNSSGTGGNLAKQTGFPSDFPEGLTSNYIDIGAAQAQSGGGGGSTEHSAVF